MAKENIELHIIHNPKLNIEDNGFGIAIFIDGIDKNVLDLSQEQMLHIGAILLNASRKFINNADKAVVKPYLRPMSSMTEEEKRHISKMMCLRTYDNGVVYDMTYPVYTPYYVMEDCLNYLRSIYMDYSGLIEKGLALEAPEGMYNIKDK